VLLVQQDFMESLSLQSINNPINNEHQKLIIKLIQLPSVLYNF